MSEPVEGDEFFAHDDRARATYRAFARPLVRLDGVTVRVSKSQVALRARRGFAYAWAPKQYLTSDVPVVISIALPHRWNRHGSKRSRTLRRRHGCITSSGGWSRRSTES